MLLIRGFLGHKVYKVYHLFRLCRGTGAAYYSLFKLFTGFINAAFTAWKLIVIKVIVIASNADTINTPGPMLIRYSYLSNQLCKK